MENFKLGINRNLLLIMSLSIVIVLLMSIMLTLPVYAHRIISYAYIEGDKIVVETAFDDGRPIKDGDVEVYDTTGTVVYEDKTDSNGICKFEVPKKSDLKIVVEAGMGHKTESTIKESDLPGVETAQQAESTQPEETQTESNKESEGSDVEAVGISEEKLRTIIREEVANELSKKLPSEIAPIKQNLVQLKNDQGPGVTEILGGIGYIFGLMGIGFYFKAKGAETD